MTRRRAVFALTAAVAALFGLNSGQAVSQPAPTPVAEILGRGTTSAPYLVGSWQNREFVARKVTIPPGGATPWHYHVGEQVVVQVQGVVERLDRNCEVHTYRAGDAYVEPAGQREIHQGINRGTEPVVFYVTDLVPVGAPFGVNVTAPACAS
ncbi:cupin domain-containing protein [Actinokineospora diospyrosa]|uniref:Cupin domain protein n=1 Tax=Actinokineospora diospyrosa TaxID=103728 RepID=A0ABT1IJ77_9PSEU|nr:cupin domain-containing protein [Actinokineospora diospyrosa]MCP2272614.1 Cupin domain protein [Actinokineospora diospyrosa]